MDEPIRKNRWIHNQRVAPDNLVKGLRLLKTGIEKTIKETEKELDKYQEALKSLTKSQREQK